MMESLVGDRKMQSACEKISSQYLNMTSTESQVLTALQECHGVVAKIAIS